MESNLLFIKQFLIYLALNLRANFSYYVFSGNIDVNSLCVQFLLSAIHGRIYIYIYIYNIFFNQKKKTRKLLKMELFKIVNTVNKSTHI